VIEITDTSCVIEPQRSVPRKVLPESLNCIQGRDTLSQEFQRFGF